LRTTTTSPADAAGRSIDTSGVASDWRARGFSCELWIDPPEQVRQDFEHDVDELTLLVEGTAQLELADKVIKLQAGDEITIPAGARYTVRNCGEGPAKWLLGYPLLSAAQAAQPAPQQAAPQQATQEASAEQ